MKELLPRLVPLKGDFGLHRSLIDCRYVPDDLDVGGPVIRFSLGIANVGQGPLHLILHNVREENGKKIASARQRIYNDGGGFREVDVDDVERTQHDPGHDAWHYDKLASFGLLDEKGKMVAPGKKTQFCMVDIFRLPDSSLSQFDISNSPTDQRFKYELGCLSDTGGEVGISIGWADNYSSRTTDQLIDISDIQTGIYTIQLQVQKTKLVTEEGVNTPKEQYRIRINKEQHKVEKIE